MRQSGNELFEDEEEYEDEDIEWDDNDSDFKDEDGDWDDMDLIEDGQTMIPIQRSSRLTLAEVLESINLPPDTNLDDIHKMYWKN